jgi:hypothetical protein
MARELNNSQEEGYEVARINSFPYGDEYDKALENARGGESIELTLTDAVEWTSTGVALKIMPAGGSEEDDGKFRPYGDESKSFQESWDLDAHPVEDTDGPSSYSFMYPLKRQQGSDPTVTSEDRTSVGVRASPTASSWSTGVAAVASAMTPTSATIAEEEEDEEKSELSEDAIVTEEMMQEVRMLSDYVRRYEQKKRLEEQARRELLDEGRRVFSTSMLNSSLDSSTLGDLNYSSMTSGAVINTSRDDSGSTPTLQYSSFASTNDSRRSPSMTATQRAAMAAQRSVAAGTRQKQVDNRQTPSPARYLASNVYDDPGELDLQSTSNSSSAEEDVGVSQRLGINPFSVQRPPARPAYKVRADDESNENLLPRTVSPEASPPAGPTARPAYDVSSVDKRRQREGVSDLPRGSYEMPASLSTLRKTNQAFLDDEDGGPSNQSADMWGGSKAAGAPKLPPSKLDTKTPPKFMVSPRGRTNNNAFNNIMDMFEAKPHNAVAPPSEHVSIHFS